MLLKWLTRYREYGLLFLRMALGIIFVCHGLPKLMGGTQLWVKVGSALGNFGITFAPAFWGFLAAMSEFGGGILLILGFCFRPALLAMAFTMVVALVMHLHHGDGFSTWSHPLTCLVVFIGLLFVGPGRYSLDRE